MLSSVPVSCDFGCLHFIAAGPIDSCSPLVTLLWLTFSVGHTTLQFGCTFLLIHCDVNSCPCMLMNPLSFVNSVFCIAVKIDRWQIVKAWYSQNILIRLFSFVLDCWVTWLAATVWHGLWRSKIWAGLNFRCCRSCRDFGHRYCKATTARTQSH